MGQTASDRCDRIWRLAGLQRQRFLKDIGSQISIEIETKMEAHHSSLTICHEGQETNLRSTKLDQFVDFLVLTVRENF